LISRLPAKQDIVSVTGLIAFIIFTWTLYRYFFKVPGWIDVLPGLDVFIILCYSMAFDLIESLAVLSACMILCFILPYTWFGKNFMAQSGITILLLTFPRLLMLQNSNHGILIILICFAILLVNILIIRLEWFNNAMTSFVDHFSLFCYVYISIGVLGFAVVILRYLFIPGH
jgi:hypothetical protein